jgi:hypothetical protein
VASHPFFLIYFLNLGWGHFGKKKKKGQNDQIAKIWKFGWGVHCKNLNFGGRIENRPKLWR